MPKPNVVIAEGTMLYFPDDVDPDSKLVVQVQSNIGGEYETVLYTPGGKVGQNFTKKELNTLVNKLYLRYCAYKLKKGDLYG